MQSKPCLDILTSHANCNFTRMHIFSMHMESLILYNSLSWIFCHSLVTLLPWEEPMRCTTSLTCLKWPTVLKTVTVHIRPINCFRISLCSSKYHYWQHIIVHRDPDSLTTCVIFFLLHLNLLPFWRNCTGRSYSSSRRRESTSFKIMHTQNSLHCWQLQQPAQEKLRKNTHITLLKVSLQLHSNFLGSKSYCIEWYLFSVSAHAINHLLSPSPYW